MADMNDIGAELRKELALTSEQLAELERARKMPIVFDDDCPETRPEDAMKFRRVNPPQKHTRI